MLIEEKPLTHWIDNFYGYGSWHARMWFIGYEESGGEIPEDVADKINYFYATHAPNNVALCDIREMYGRITLRPEHSKSSLFTNRCQYRFGSNAVQNGVWKNLIAFEHGYRNEKLPDLLEYQKHIFTSPLESRESLISLYPLPGPHSHAWYYSWLDLAQLPFLKSRTLYEQHVYERRIYTILLNITTYKPEVVLMYGMNNITALKKSVQQFFDKVKFKMVKATKQQIPQYHCTEIDGTTILITTQVPALKHNRVETGFDWEEFGKVVKAEN